MSKYLLLIVGEEEGRVKMPEEERAKMFQAYYKYTQDLIAAKKMIAGEPLLPSAQDAARIKVRAGKRTVVDGPFTETKEVIGGYYLIEAESLGEAKDWAAKCPGAEFGHMEVRGIMPMSMEQDPRKS